MRGVAAILAAFAAATLTTSVDVRAQDLFDFLFGPDRPAYRAAGPSRWAPRPHARPRVSARARLRFARLVEPKASTASPSGESSFATTRSDGFCVRTCDGYFFPLIKSEFVTRQQSCEYACPSAPMAVYEGSAIEQAQNHRGEKYELLPAAFSFRDKVTQHCSCNRPEDSQAFFTRISRADPTLRAGDIILDRKEALVYRGSDFAPAEGSSFVSSWTRERLRALLGRAGSKSRADAAKTLPESTRATAAEPEKIDPRLLSPDSPGPKISIGEPTPIGKL